jgi:phenylpropionate dioxygenase-like ring-hydroxylating dioxygenase large terminal subunit
MGNLMREYWIPALPSREFKGPDAIPKRMRLLGENLVMFRDSLGRMGALEESCPHRGASLYFGRNEEAGLRCPYHGWKFDVEGNCLETPTEPLENRNYKDRIKAKAYPLHEVNKMIWIYMGSRPTPPPFPEFPINLIPDENAGEPIIMMEEANYLQNMEGDLAGGAQTRTRSRNWTFMRPTTGSSTRASARCRTAPNGTASTSSSTRATR